jgi:hypothetical protein
MATSSLIRTSAAAAVCAAAAALAPGAGSAAASPVAAGTCGGARTLAAASSPAALDVRTTLGREPAVAPSYGWPVKPFDRQHPIRANLDDPRIGARGSLAFHFGVDVAVPDRTPVYAVAPGVAYVKKGSVAVARDSEHVFGYWHVDAVVADHAPIRLHQLLGYVQSGWGHVHFAERVDGVYRNPLRPGGLGPYADVTAPRIGEIDVVRTTRGIEILANAYDMPSQRVPGAWSGEPVSPALLRWRLERAGVAGRWQTAADFRTHMLDARLFHSIYASPTAQNHKGKAGLYCFFLSHAWKPADGRYRIEVAATDTRGNRAIGRLEVTIAHAGVLS